MCSIMAASSRRRRDERMKRAVAASVAASYADKGLARQNWHQYRAARKRKKE